MRPGSPAARAAGCCCPVADNADLVGAGKTRAEDPYVVVSRCPLHGHIFKRPAGAVGRELTDQTNVGRERWWEDQ